MSERFSIRSGESYQRAGSIGGALCLFRELISSRQKYFITVMDSSGIREASSTLKALITTPVYSVETVGDFLRALTLAEGIFIVPLLSWFAPISPRGFEKKHTLTLQTSDSFSPAAIIERLSEHGYHYEATTSDEMSYALRWDILDVRPWGMKKYRISHFGDSIDGVFHFSDSGSLTRLEEIVLPLPPVVSEALHWDPTLRKDGGLLSLTVGSPHLVIGADFHTAELAQMRAYGEEMTEIFLWPHLQSRDLSGPQLSIRSIDDLVEVLSREKVLALTSRWSRLRSLCSERSIREPEIIAGRMNVPSRRYEKLTIIGDDILSHLLTIHHRRRSVSDELDLLLHIREGDLVTHLDHGIGRFMSIVEKDLSGKREYMEVMYRGWAKLFVPMTEIAKITKYVGESETELAELGSLNWRKTLDATDEEVAQIAEELLDIHAKGLSTVAHVLTAHEEKERAFRAAFPYVHTVDQASAIDAILSDMAGEKAMDRLLVGDVWFGKTEVAMNAIYRAFLSGGQSLLLSPLVVLAYEHGETLARRLGAFGVCVRVLTRLTPQSERTEILKGLRSGSVHVVVGTHGILSDTVACHALALIIVDEEHRFGVEHKERFRAYRQGVHILSMSATPIPRSLNLALSGIRSISTLATPPTERQSIETHVHAYRDDIVVDAVRSEIARGWQVIILYNSIRGMDGFCEKVQTLLWKEIRIVMTHAQMNGNLVEDRIWDFKRRMYDILITTTIVENGVNFLASNTIIVVDADKFGLSQLHQIRGRVGRTDQKADCYLLYGHKGIGEDAKKRLLTIAEHSSLGAGFELAMRDMEIRWVGEVLGLRQSGKTALVGMALYLKMLEEKIRSLRGDTSSQPLTRIDIPLSWHLDAQDFPTSEERLALFRDFESIRSQGDLSSLMDDLEPRQRWWTDNSRDAIRILSDLTRARIHLTTFSVESVKRVGNDYVIEMREGVSPQSVRSLLDSIDREGRYTLLSLRRLRTSAHHWSTVHDYLKGLVGE